MLSFKTCVTAVALSVCCSCALSMSDSALVLKVRKSVAEIDRQTKRTPKIKITIDDLSVEGGEATVWRKKTSVKADATLYGESGRSEMLVYWEKERPLFAYHKRITYAAQLGEPVPKGAKDTVRSIRLYYDLKGVQGCRIDGKEVPPSNETCVSTATLVSELHKKVAIAK